MAFHAISRSKSMSFIGLGKMGYQMAYNLFSKQYVQDNDSQFVVCDTNLDTVQSFGTTFITQYPSAHITYAETPEKLVYDIPLQFNSHLKLAIGQLCCLVEL